MINTVFPIYSGLAMILANKDYFSSRPTRLYCMNNKLLPFQLSVASTFSTVTDMNLYNANTGALVENLYTHIDSNEWEVSDFTSITKKYIQYLGTLAFTGSHTLADGDYYFRLNTDVGIYYSEVFTVCADLATKGRWIKIEFYNENDIKDTEPICYQNSWKQIIYLDADIKASGHVTVKEVDERDGYELPRSTSIYEVKRIRTYLSESMYRGLIRLPGHSHVTVYDRDNNSYAASRITVGDPAWSGSGAYCRCTIEFMVESATSKNTNLNLT